MYFRNPTDEEHELVVKYWANEIGKRIKKNVGSISKMIGLFLLTFGGISFFLFLRLDLGTIFSLLIGFFLVWISSELKKLNREHIDKYNDIINRRYKVAEAQTVDAYYHTSDSIRGNYGYVKVLSDNVFKSIDYSFPWPLILKYLKLRKFVFSVLLIEFNKCYSEKTSYKRLSIPLEDGGDNDEQTH